MVDQVSAPTRAPRQAMFADDRLGREGQIEMAKLLWPPADHSLVVDDDRLAGPATEQLGIGKHR